MSNQTRYVVISPAKDEAQRIDKTIQSMLRQTIIPVCWVIVDDGSRDQTPAIVESYQHVAPWISLVRVERDGERKLGSAEIRAFEIGYKTVRSMDFDFVVKLDCDLEFGPDYFEQLISRFASDPDLGIASGVYVENREGTWSEGKMPLYHASGASKMVRAKCFSDIGGFPLFPGWDTADEIKAQVRGWKTGHFSDLKFIHLRPEGSATGGVSTGILHGRVYYVTGGGPLFFLFKVADRVIHGKPVVLGAVALLWGYLRSWATRTERLVTKSEATFYRAQLNKRLLEGIQKKFQLGVKPREMRGTN
ncbi:MAG: glycosyltransferase family A protein [Candidatus Acidiferrum sp.]